MDYELLEALVIADIAERTGATVEEVTADFYNYNAAIDKLIAEDGLTEEEAIAKVYKTWEFGFLK